jgi:hypothetical protein
MIPRPESPFDRALNRKVRILLSRRNDFPAGNLTAVVSRRDDDADLENLHPIPAIDIPSGDARVAEV